MKKTLILSVAAVLIVIAVAVIYAGNSSTASMIGRSDPAEKTIQPGSAQAAVSPSEKGKEIGEAMKAVFDQIAREKKSGLSERDPSRVVGTVDGVDIHAGDVEGKAALYQAAGSKHPLEDAWKTLKFQAYEKSFARKHNLLPTVDEIAQASQQMRKDAESSEDGIAFETSLFQAMGMTADEYWNVYKPKYEMPAELIDENIAKYDQEHGEKLLSKEDIKGELKDPILRSEYPDPD